MTVCFQFMNGPRKPWEGQSFADQLGDLLEAAEDPAWIRVRSPADAEIIVLVESCEHKTWRYLPVMASNEFLRARPNDCFVLNYEDDAAGLLPGCYAGLAASRFDVTRHRASAYILPEDTSLELNARSRRSISPELLFSFRGARSHSIRDGIFARAETWREFGPIRRIDRWFDHTPDEKAEYFDEIARSWFVLCPRGIAASSHRLFEVMQFGRVPVIISDEWLAPDGPAWDGCSIRVAEADLDAIPALLAGRRRDAEEMGAFARREWERWFSPERRVLVALEAIASIRAKRAGGHDESRQLRAWHGWSRQWGLGWTLPQRCWRKLWRLLRRD